MTILITNNFSVRRIGSVAVATIVEDWPSSETLTAAQCRTAADAFNMLAVMLGDVEDVYPEQDRAASAADRDYQLAKEEAA